MMGGQLTVSSQMSVGSTFAIEIPRRIEIIEAPDLSDQQDPVLIMMACNMETVAC